MQSELKSLSKIFSEVIFRIPDYQRGYSWETKHLKDFWNDIEQLPDSKSHYTGVLTLEPVSAENYEKWEDDIWIIDSKHYSPMYVVDGQQRLTTAIILLQCILDKIPEDQLLNFTEKKMIFERNTYVKQKAKEYQSHIYLDMKKTIQAMNSSNKKYLVTSQFCTTFQRKQFIQKTWSPLKNFSTKNY